MIENILQLLQIAKENQLIGQYVDIALGKNKLPESVREASAQIQRKLSMSRNEITVLPFPLVYICIPIYDNYPPLFLLMHFYQTLVRRKNTKRGRKNKLPKKITTPS